MLQSCGPLHCAVWWVLVICVLEVCSPYQTTWCHNPELPYMTCVGPLTLIYKSLKLKKYIIKIKTCLICPLMADKHMQYETVFTLPVTYPGRSVTSTVSKLLCSILGLLSPGTKGLSPTVHLHLLPRSRMCGTLLPCPLTHEIVHHKCSLYFELILKYLFLQMQGSQLLEGK